MVLFHCAFVALKARCPLTINVNPDDYKLAGEDRLFHGYTRTPIPLRMFRSYTDVLTDRKIIDDGFEHSLTIFQDRRAHGIRLHAAVGSGELKKCPVWTAFGRTYLFRARSKVILLRPFFKAFLSLVMSSLSQILHSVIDKIVIVTHSSASPDWFTRRSPHRIWIKDIQLYVFCKNYRMKNQIRKHGVFEITFIAEAGMSTSPGYFWSRIGSHKLIASSGRCI
jgi:hypothetical protein